MDKRFFIELSHQERIRIHLKIERGQINDLVVQLETWNKKWIPVVRYNYAHGIPHRDLLYADGRRGKEWLKGKKLEHVVNEAINDIKENWEKYLTRCGYEEEK